MKNINKLRAIRDFCDFLIYTNFYILFVLSKWIVVFLYINKKYIDQIKHNEIG